MAGAGCRSGETLRGVTLKPRCPGRAWVKAPGSRTLMRPVLPKTLRGVVMDRTKILTEAIHNRAVPLNYRTFSVAPAMRGLSLCLNCPVHRLTDVNGATKLGRYTKLASNLPSACDGGAVRQRAHDTTKSGMNFELSLAFRTFGR